MSSTVASSLSVLCWLPDRIVRLSAGTEERQMNLLHHRAVPLSPWADCMERAREHAKLLVDVGLDFKDLVGRGVDGWGGSAGSEGSE